MIERRAFRAMGTEIELLLDSRPDRKDADALVRTEDEFHRLESILSRFRPGSELSTLNRAGSVRASDELMEVVELALAARRRTEGRFDPTVHDALAAAGYDRSFEAVAACGPAAVAAPVRCGGDVVVDRESSTILVEPGFRLDLGGIGKGYAVDRACAVLGEAGSCLVNAGGDLAVAGGGRSWPVGVETGGVALTLALDSGAIATSGRDRRRWTRGGEELHHLIDPRTGRPADVDLLRVTVVSTTAVAAEVLAKALFLAGAEAAVAEADQSGTPCVLVTTDGETILAGGLS